MEREIHVVAPIGPKDGSRPDPDTVIAAFARRQHDVVGREQLLKAGVGAKAIKHRVTRKRLRRIHRGVYAVGQRKLSMEGRFIAAVLAAGEGAVLMGRSAAQLWRMQHEKRGPVQVSVTHGGRAPDGIEFHRTTLAPDEVTRVRGIPVTTVPRTIVDLAAEASKREVERAMEEAEIRNLPRRRQVGALAARHPRRRGIATVNAILADQRVGTTRTRNDFEELFLAFVERVGLPMPLFNQRLEIGRRCYEPDCMWPEQQVIVELDGRATHDTAKDFEESRARDRALAAAGWRPMRVTWLQLLREQAQLHAELVAVLAGREAA